MKPTRRQWMRGAAAVTLGFTGLHKGIDAQGASDAANGSTRIAKLLADPKGVLDLPEGFTYHVFSKWGEKMDDGLLVPGKHDGMAAFPGPNGKTILVRNHEVADEQIHHGPFGKKMELADRVDPKKVYDQGRNGKGPWRGGTTTLVYDTKTRKLERHFLSLAGTKKNCAGGPTPWNSWITCEEWTQKADDQCAVDHGYCFDVPATATPGLADPKPIHALGRFRHEAIAVDPDTGIVYETEDEQDGLIYRMIPNDRNDLQKGGRLQAMAIRDVPSADTRNWLDKQNKPVGTPFPIGGVAAVEWIDVTDTHNPNNDLRHRGHKAGAALFARGEGMWFGRRSVYFACTSGGAARVGQIFRYVPSRFEGQPDEERFPGRLQLFIEPNDKSVVEYADNLTVAPWGDLIVCEDGKGDQFLVRVTPQGEITRFARNAVNNHEFAGACFSPDGTTLFVNIQGVGYTLAITGPWQSLK